MQDRLLGKRTAALAAWISFVMLAGVAAFSTSASKAATILIAVLMADGGRVEGAAGTGVVVRPATATCETKNTGISLAVSYNGLTNHVASLGSCKSGSMPIRDAHRRMHKIDRLTERLPHESRQYTMIQDKINTA